MKDDDFLIKLQQKLFEIDLLIDEYEMRDRLLSIFVAGILEPIDDNTSTMKAMYGYSIENREELDTMIDFIKDTWKEQEDISRGDDFEDLLNSMGISLN
jgi:phage/plasmid-associated DNA primase